MIEQDERAREEGDRCQTVGRLFNGNTPIGVTGIGAGGGPGKYCWPIGRFSKTVLGFGYAAVRQTFSAHCANST